MTKTFLALAGVFLVIGLLSAYPLVAGVALVIALATCATVGTWRLNRAIRRRRLDDAEKQHAALMRGEDLYGIYGRFPPVDLRPESQVATPKMEWFDSFTYENVRR